jgi:hypothetical protein
LIDIVDQQRVEVNSECFCLLLLLGQDLDTLTNGLVDVVVLQLIDQSADFKFLLKT